MWFGTEGGGSDPHSLSHDLVNEFYEGGSGTLWVGTDGAG